MSHTTLPLAALSKALYEQEKRAACERPDSPSKELHIDLPIEKIVKQFQTTAANAWLEEHISQWKKNSKRSIVAFSSELAAKVNDVDTIDVSGIPDEEREKLIRAFPHLRRVTIDRELTATLYYTIKDIVALAELHLVKKTIACKYDLQGLARARVGLKIFVRK